MRQRAFLYAAAAAAMTTFSIALLVIGLMTSVYAHMDDHGKSSILIHMRLASM